MSQRDTVLAHCLAKPGALEDYPWGEDDLVVKVGGKDGKIFAFLGSDEPPGGVGLKCGRDADEAKDLRDRYPEAVTVSAYIGRYGWNAIRLDGTLPDDEVLELVDASYDAVVKALPKAKRP